MDFFGRLSVGLQKTRSHISSIVKQNARFDEGFYGALEEALIAADVGLERTLDIVDRLKKEIAASGTTTTAEAYALMKRMMADDLTVNRFPDEFPPKPWVIVVVGVNGVGKTTTIGKLAGQMRGIGKKVMLGAADTFRAGAIEQLRIWAQRTGSEFIAQHEGADAASVAFDAMEAAKARDCDVLILDTAGRLHTKTNLMNELEKILRVIRRNTPHAPNEILLVVDATTGQNAVSQVEAFHRMVTLTGLIITKLDGTAKGGIVLSLTKKYGIPVRKIGVGEAIDDLQDFDPRAYVEAMFGDL